MNGKTLALRAKRGLLPESRWQALTVISVLALLEVLGPHAFGRASAVASPPLQDGVVPAPFGFEAATDRYVAKETTAVYISPFFWAGKVKGAEIKAGQPVRVLAKPKDYDWLLVGRNGNGIGYVPLSSVSEASR